MTAFPQITHVLFDMDGLLLDTEKVYTEVTQEIVSRYGKTYTWDLKAKMMGQKARDACELLVRELELPISAEEYLNERNEMHKARFPFCKVMPGAMKLVSHLKSSNVPIAVATSSHRDAFEIKSQNNKELFSHFGSNIICGDDSQVHRGKPHPDIFLVAAKRIGFDTSLEDPKQCLVFEDAPSGVQAAVNAGMSVVWVPDPQLKRDPELVKKCTLVLNSLEDFDPSVFGLQSY